ncbi:MAG: phosphoglycerate kinase, partial [Pseudomonadota bacterium]|nr:phosphoglycerate kinase [Pseudomonadota bacterium]
MTFLRMEDLDLTGKQVLIREDLNVPVKDGIVSNDMRIRAALPTIEQAMARSKKVILMSHLGRPEEGRPMSTQREFSLRPVANRLTELLACQVELIEGYLDDPDTVSKYDAGIVLLENVRINSGEKANDDELAARYARLCDVFVMDAFGTAHRAQASTHGVAKHAPTACAGPLLTQELYALDRSMMNPERPMLAIVGGAKVSSKLEVLNKLANKVDQLIVGGGIANTFLLASGMKVGRSLCEPEFVDTANVLMQRTNIPLPTDVVVAKEISSSAEAYVKTVSAIEDDDFILDIGPNTATQLINLISNMKTIIWNGPIGVFELPQ